MAHGEDKDDEFAVLNVTDEAMVADPVAPQAAKLTCQ
jgi:hypothetical protein